MQSSYGFHIIRVDDKQAAHVKTLDEVKDQIEERHQAAESGPGRCKSGQRAAGAGPRRGLEKAAAAKGLNVINTDFVSRTDNLPGIGNSPQFMSAVFGQAEKAPPDQVPVAAGIRGVRGTGDQASGSRRRLRRFAAGWKQNSRTNAWPRLLSQKTQELADRAKAEHDLKKAAKEAGAAMKTSDFVLPDGQVPDIGSMTGRAAVAFTLKPGEISGPITNGNTGVVLSILGQAGADPAGF